MKKSNAIDAETLRKLMRYDPKSGLFYRLVDSKRGRKKAGDVAGARANTTAGYVEFCVDGKKYLAHRLAWLYMTGNWPKHQVDHIDGDKSNNVFSNLREVTNGQNQQNMVSAKSHNKSGFLGVSRNKKGWKAEIRYNGVRLHIGTYSTPELAHKAYLETKRKLHIEVTREI